VTGVQTCALPIYSQGLFPWNWAITNGDAVDNGYSWITVVTPFSRPNSWEGDAFQPSGPTGPLSTDCVQQ